MPGIHMCNIQISLVVNVETFRHVRNTCICHGFNTTVALHIQYAVSKTVPFSIYYHSVQFPFSLSLVLTWCYLPIPSTTFCLQYVYMYKNTGLHHMAILLGMCMQKLI